MNYLRLGVLIASFQLVGLTVHADDDPFTPKKTDAKPEEISSHPDGETPLARMTALAHTEALPKCDRIVVYSLSLPKPSADSPRNSIPQVESFPIRPYKAKARVLATKTLEGREVVLLSNVWRSMTFDKWASAFCHKPAYGLRFYRNDLLLFETSLCFECTNFYIPDVAPVEGDSGGDSAYQWYGFSKNEHSDKLLSELQRHLNQLP